ncbi:MAG: hypothetical protein V3W31_04585 [Thermodesulfobacteriota bacterium]
MSMQSVFVLVGIFVALMFFYKYAGRWVKTLPADTVKKINWLGFGLALAGGTTWYFVKEPAIMLVTLVGVAIYFLFYDYDNMEEKEREEERKKRMTGGPRQGGDT